MPNPVPTPAHAAPPPAAPKPRRRRGLMLVATTVVVLLLGGGAAAYWLLAGQDRAGETETEPAPEPKKEGAVVALDPFIVNLADPGGTRFFRVTLSLVVEDETHALEIGENELVQVRVRSAILELLAQQIADRLITPEGKTELKHAIADGAAAAVEGLHITDVLFSEFIVQF